MYFIFQTKKINYWESETCMTIFFITYLQPYHLLNGTSTKEIVNDEKKKKTNKENIFEPKHGFESHGYQHNYIIFSQTYIWN